MSPIIRPEMPTDGDPIRAVNERAFGRADEARLVDALRDGGYVARIEGSRPDGAARLIPGRESPNRLLHVFQPRRFLDRMPRAGPNDCKHLLQKEKAVPIEDGLVRKYTREDSNL